jgi:hypothetical protein
VKDDRAALALHHVFCDLAAHQETGKGRHFPDLAIDLRGRVGDAKADIGTDVEHGDLDRADIAFDAFDQRDHCILVARIRRIGLRLIPPIADRLRQFLQLVGMARTAVDAGGVAFGGKGLGDGAAGCITGTDNQGCGHKRISLALHSNYDKHSNK